MPPTKTSTKKTASSSSSKTTSKAKSTPAKRKRSEPDKNAPRSAVTAYQLYQHEEREELADGDKIKGTELTKLVNEAWKAFDRTSQRMKTYEAIAAEDKERYDEEQADYEKTGNPAPSSINVYGKDRDWAALLDGNGDADQSDDDDTNTKAAAASSSKTTKKKKDDGGKKKKVAAASSDDGESSEEEDEAPAVSKKDKSKAAKAKKDKAVNLSEEEGDDDAADGGNDDGAPAPKKQKVGADKKADEE